MQSLRGAQGAANGVLTLKTSCKSKPIREEENLAAFKYTKHDTNLPNLH